MKKAILSCLLLTGAVLGANAGHLIYTGTNGPGVGRHIVLLAGDEEYRSEEAMPMMARILAFRHGFKCTVLFSMDPASGEIDPLNKTHLPGLEVLSSADLCFMFLRFRELPDSQMRHFVDFVNSGKPMIALRTSTHAFSYDLNKGSPYAKYDWRCKEWPGGFGQQVLGETWVNHHGAHGKESTRGVLRAGDGSQERYPATAPVLQILRGVKDIWGPSDVYAVTHLPQDAQVLVWGQVLQGMRPSDAPVTGPKNDPMMPLIWLREHTGESGRKSQVLTSTIGAAVDLESEDLRRLFVNGCYYLTGLRVPQKADARCVGEYKPTYFGFGKHIKGIKPADLE